MMNGIEDVSLDKVDEAKELKIKNPSGKEENWNVKH